MSTFEYLIIGVGGLGVAWVAVRVVASAWFSAKFDYHKRISRYLTKGDQDG